MGNTEFFDSNNYEFNKGCKRGVYLIHGFTSSTYEFLDLANFLSENGFYVRLDNLPGHGTTVDDCNATKYAEWIDHVERGVAEVASECDEVHVISISMGAVLGLHLATVFPLASLVEAAVVFQFMDEFSVRILVPLLNCIITKQSKYLQYKKDGGKKLKYFGYTEYPMKALNQMRKLTNYVRPRLSQVKCPTMLIHTKPDLTSNMDNYHIVKNAISSEKQMDLILEKSTHNLFSTGPDQKFIFENVLTFLNTQSKIL
jgi:carboxylesterase